MDKVKKISFPKGSLKFVKIQSKPMPIPDYKDLSKREFVNNMFESYFPNKKKETLPMDIQDQINSNQLHIKDMRMYLKGLPGDAIKNNYRITFKHPKWSKVLGTIQVDSNKKNLRDTLKGIADAFRKKKDNFRKLRFKEKSQEIKAYDHALLKYKVSGGCIFMPEVKDGVYVMFLKEQERKIVFGDKQPKETDQKYVGIELEFLCNVDKNVLGNKLFDAGLGRYVTVKEDHSIKCSHGRNPFECEEHKGVEHAHELCIIAKENEYVEVVRKVTVILEELKATVNKTCGMHVHVDCRTRDPEKVYQNLVSSQAILLRMNPKSRIEKYARLNKERDFEMAKNNGGDRGGHIDEGRYYAINAKAYTKHKTIEIRVHAGTVDFKKITNWANILVCIANCKERYVRSFATINTFCKRFGIADEVQEYIKDRINKFKIKVEGGVEVAPEAERGVA